MLVADPASFMFVSTLVGLVAAVLLFASHVGLGEEASALRWWIAGDIVLGLHRAIFLMQPHALGPQYAGVEWLTPRVAFVSATTLVVLAVALHGVSLARLAGRPWPGRVMAAVAAALACAYLAGAIVLPAGLPRVMWLLGFVAAVVAGKIFVVWPIVMRYRGTKILAVVMAGIVLYNAALCVAMVARPPAPLAAGTPAFPPLPALVVDFVVSLLLTISLMLTLQERLRARILALSVTDPLTGLLNRRGAIPLLERELSRAVRYGRPLSIALLDLDHFKRINDTFGHASGDAALFGFARRIETLKRKDDVLARWGGEEFLMALPETGGAQALRVLDRMRAAVCAAPLAASLPVITVSCGVAALGHSATSARLESLLDAADKSLYAAKEQRNCVVATAAAGFVPQKVGSGGLADVTAEVPNRAAEGA